LKAACSALTLVGVVVVVEVVASDLVAQLESKQAAVRRIRRITGLIFMRDSLATAVPVVSPPSYSPCNKRKMAHLLFHKWDIDFPFPGSELLTCFVAHYALNQ
jgi:hypothetical protein